MDFFRKFAVIVGLAGLVAVWAAANFYVGRLEISLDRQIAGLAITVSNNDGQCAVYTSPSIRLMPGNYHLAVAGKGVKTSEMETSVEFGKTTLVSIETDSMD